MGFNWKITKVEKTETTEEHFDLTISDGKKETIYKADSWQLRHFMQDIDIANHH